MVVFHFLSNLIPYLFLKKKKFLRYSDYTRSILSEQGIKLSLISEVRTRTVHSITVSIYLVIKLSLMEIDRLVSKDVRSSYGAITLTRQLDKCKNIRSYCHGLMFSNLLQYQTKNKKRKSDPYIEVSWKSFITH